NAFSVSNAGKIAGQAQSAAGNEQAIRYDAAAAEAQWTKLQQAQELGMAKVQPIHVNLPTRGLRHAFSQVLQIEENKPLTIHLLAANTTMISWPGRIATSLLGFGLLWLGVAAIANRRPAEARG